VPVPTLGMSLGRRSPRPTPSGGVADVAAASQPPASNPPPPALGAATVVPPTTAAAAAAASVPASAAEHQGTAAAAAATTTPTPTVGDRRSVGSPQLPAPAAVAQLASPASPHPRSAVPAPSTMPRVNPRLNSREVSLPSQDSSVPPPGVCVAGAPVTAATPVRAAASPSAHAPAAASPPRASLIARMVPATAVSAPPWLSPAPDGAEGRAQDVEFSVPLRD
jgi:hypothetical protein